MNNHKRNIFLCSSLFLSIIFTQSNLANEIRLSELQKDLQNNRWEVVEKLIKDDPENQVLSRYERMILYYAGLAGKIEVVKYYIERGSDIDKDLNKGFTLLHLATRAGKTELAEYLIEKGANLTLQTNEKMTPIMFAVTHKRKEIEEMLIEKGITKDIFTETIRGDIQAVMNYLAENPNLINQYKGHFSLLHWAAYKGHYDLAKMLIEKGADVEGHKEYASPLFWAVRYNRPDIAKLLMDNGADINAKNANGQSVLFNSARVEITRFLLENGANAGIMDIAGNAPLHIIGSKNMHIEAIRTLIDFNELPNFPQSESIIQEAINEQLGVAKLLIEYGANPNLRNKAGKTALDFAIEGGFEQIIRFFSQYQDVETISTTLDQNDLPNPPFKIISSGWGGSWSPDGNQLVYSKPGGTGLQILDIATGQSTTLTHNGKDPVWSPDGRYIAYVQEPSFNVYYDEEVWIIKPNGEDSRHILNGGYPRWSKDGKTLYVHSRVNEQIMVINVDDNQINPEVFFENTLSWYPSISPDGNLIAFGSNGELTVVERATGKKILSSDVNGERGLLASWSPDGHYITYGGFDGSQLGLWILDVKKTDAVLLAAGPFTLPMWSEDGKQVSFDFRFGGTRDVWIASSDWIDARIKGIVPPIYNIQSEPVSIRIVQPQPVSLIGKPLPDISNLLVGFNPDTIQGKSVLVCFWDIEQRPSRQLVTELSKRADEINQKNVIVLLIHSSEITLPELKKWLDEYKITFISERVVKDFEGTLFRWNVRAQPWLILTDENHIVTDEGFNIKDLDEKIALNE